MKDSKANAHAGCDSSWQSSTALIGRRAAAAGEVSSGLSLHLITALDQAKVARYMCLIAVIRGLDEAAIAAQKGKSYNCRLAIDHSV